MIGAVFTLIGGLRGIVSALAGAFIAVALTVLFYEGIPIGPLARIPLIGNVLSDITDGRVDRERKAALQGYVAESRAVAAEAKLAETQRQLEAGRKAADGYAELLAAAQADLAERAAVDEATISEYEKRLGDRGRLDAADIEFLRK